MVALRAAELEFVRGLIKDIESGQLTGLDEWRSWFPDGASRPDPPSRPSRPMSPS